MEQITRKQFAMGSIVLHWSIAILVLLMLSLSFFLDDVAKAYQGTAYMLHKSLGLTVLFLMVIRLLVLVRWKRPSLPSTMRIWEKCLAHGVQHSLYLLLLAMPLCGWIMSLSGGRVPRYFGLLPMRIPGILPNKAVEEWMQQAHNLMAWFLIALIALHIVGALKHYFLDKDRVMQSMWFK